MQDCVLVQEGYNDISVLKCGSEGSLKYKIIQTIRQGKVVDTLLLRAVDLKTEFVEVETVIIRRRDNKVRKPTTQAIQLQAYAR